MKPCKVRCPNWWWSRKIQIEAAKALGCTWGVTGCPIPWQPRKFLLLFITLSYENKWLFQWGAEWEFDQCPYPEVTPHQLLEMIKEKE